MFIHFLCMLVYFFFCLCPLRLVIMLNFNIPKVAYCIPTAKATCLQWTYSLYITYLLQLTFLLNVWFILYCYISNVVHHNIIKIISMFYTVEALVKKSVVTGAGCLQEYYCSVPLVEQESLREFYRGHFCLGNPHGKVVFINKFVRRHENLFYCKYSLEMKTRCNE